MDTQEAAWWPRHVWVRRYRTLDARHVPPLLVSVDTDRVGFGRALGPTGAALFERRDQDGHLAVLAMGWTLGDVLRAAHAAGVAHGNLQLEHISLRAGFWSLGGWSVGLAATPDAIAADVDGLRRALHAACAAQGGDVDGSYCAEPLTLLDGPRPDLDRFLARAEQVLRAAHGGDAEPPAYATPTQPPPDAGRPAYATPTRPPPGAAPAPRRAPTGAMPTLPLPAPPTSPPPPLPLAPATPTRVQPRGATATAVSIGVVAGAVLVASLAGLWLWPPSTAGLDGLSGAASRGPSSTTPSTAEGARAAAAAARSEPGAAAPSDLAAVAAPSGAAAAAAQAGAALGAVQAAGPAGARAAGATPRGDAAAVAAQDDAGAPADAQPDGAPPAVAIDAAPPRDADAGLHPMAAAAFQPAPKRRRPPRSARPVPAGTVLLGLDVRRLKKAACPEGVPCPAVPTVEQANGSVRVDAFRLDRAEVSRKAYARCVDDGACPDLKLPAGGRHRPQTHTPRDAAAAYCAWRGGRLPTFAEWQRAARGDDTRLFPWGDDPPFVPPHRRRAHVVTSKDFPLTIGRYAEFAGPYGHINLVGNVREWTADGPATAAVTAGGSFRDAPADLRVTRRATTRADRRDDDLGFRCAY